MGAETTGQARLPGVRLGNGQIATLLVGVAASVTAAATIHGQFFMPNIEKMVDRKIEKEHEEHDSLPHRGAITDADLSRAMEPLQVGIRHLSAAVQRLTDKIDRLEER